MREPGRQGTVRETSEVDRSIRSPDFLYRSTSAVMPVRRELGGSSGPLKEAIAAIDTALRDR